MNTRSRYPIPDKRIESVKRQAFQGMCLALIKANADKGKIKITATSPHLQSASTELTVAGASRP